jgi:hypothetical protein
MKRRTWRLNLAAAWLSGTSAVIIAVRLNMRPVDVEREVRRVVSSAEGLREAQRLSMKVR